MSNQKKKKNEKIEGKKAFFFKNLQFVLFYFLSLHFLRYQT